MPLRVLSLGLSFALGHGRVSRSLLRLRVPDGCPACRVSGTVALETTITGAEVLLRWCCRSCSHDWLVTDAEVTAAERRTSPRDRRRTSRTERRGRRDQG
jgi:hypothetical protein